MKGREGTLYKKPTPRPTKRWTRGAVNEAPKAVSEKPLRAMSEFETRSTKHNLRVRRQLLREQDRFAPPTELPQARTVRPSKALGMPKTSPMTLSKVTSSSAMVLIQMHDMKKPKPRNSCRIGKSKHNHSTICGYVTRTGS